MIFDFVKHSLVCISVDMLYIGPAADYGKDNILAIVKKKH